jgi:glycosyltransferase involved in cell wall biosynthesis
MISVIITVLNENSDYLNNTISSLRCGANSGLEIVVVDDGSDRKIDIIDKKVIYHRNPFRMGVGRSRHIGATLAKNGWLLFTDSHMTFQNDWYKEFNKLSATKDTLLCGACLGLAEGEMDISKYNGRYHGARLALYEKPTNQVLEGKWIESKDGDGYELSCIMGAVYLIPREFFFKIRGLSDIKMWGCDEPCLAIKTWLSGGSVKMAKTIVAGHQFRDFAPYVTPNKFLLYNKMRLCKSFFPEDLARNLISKLPQDTQFFEACQMINKDKKEIEEYKKYYQSIFVRDVYWLCVKFNIDISQLK